MGDAQRKGSLASLVIFLDENHCRNPHVLTALATAGVKCEKHLDHFRAGTDDTEWLPAIAAHGWCLLTTDARIRTNQLERRCVKEHRLRMFYFSRNDIAGAQMGIALTKALPQIMHLFATQTPPFTASITKSGEVNLRDTFDDSN